MEENSKEVAFKKRKNQEILDFILFLKKYFNMIAEFRTKAQELYIKN